MLKSFILAVAMLLIPGSLLASEATKISQTDLLKMQQQNDLVILDVRTKAEYDAGHIEGALNISHDKILENLDKIPKDKDLVVYCRSGRRAGVAIDLLAKHGYERLYHLSGDMNGWLGNNMPVSVN